MGASLTWGQSGTNIRSLYICGWWKWYKNLCKVLQKCQEFPVGKSTLCLSLWDQSGTGKPGCSKALNTVPCSALLCHWLTTWDCCRDEALKQLLNLSHCLSLLENTVLFLLALLPSLLWLTSQWRGSAGFVSCHVGQLLSSTIGSKKRECGGRRPLLASYMWAGGRIFLALKGFPFLSSARDHYQFCIKHFFLSPW